MTKIAVVGTGAMGSLYAGLLGDAGNEVWGIDVWEEHVDAIAERGLRVSGASGDRVVRINATTDASEVGEVDVVIIATKAFHVHDAVQTARALLGPDTVVIPIQNGLGSAEAVVDLLGEARVVIGVVGGFGSSIVKPGHVLHQGLGLVRLGESTGPATARLERIATLWRDAGFTVKTYDDIDQLVWEKLICNVAFSGTCALLELTIGEVLGDPNAWQVAAGCAQEAYDVGLASGIQLEIRDPVGYVADFGAKIPGARPSTLLDLMNGNPCEIDVINGAIPPRARPLGLAAPFNEVVTALVKARQAVLVADRQQDAVPAGSDGV